MIRRAVLSKMNARHQRWLRQRTLLPLFMVTAMCIIGLEGTMIRPGQPSAGPSTHLTADGVGPLSNSSSSSSSSAATERHRRLIPYMQYYVTSTAGPPSASGDGGPSDTGDYQPSFNPLYNYRPINVPVRQEPAAGADIRAAYYTAKHAKPQQQPQQQSYRTQEEPYELPRSPVVVHRKPYYGTAPAKLISSTGLKSLPASSSSSSSSSSSASINPFTYEYNHRHHPQGVKVVSVGGGSAGAPTSYAVLSTGDHTGSDLYERPKYAVIPRERDQYEQVVVPQRFAVLPAKVYGLEEGADDLPAAGKYFLPAGPGERSKPSALYQSVPVAYKKKIINPFLPSNTIPGPFTPMTGGSSGSSSGSSGGSVKNTFSTQHQQEGTRGGSQTSYVKNAVTEQPSVAIYSSYDHGAPVQDHRGHGDPSVSSPYVVVKTVPKFYYEKPRITGPTPAPSPYPVYYKEKPSEGRKQHSNHSGYTRPRIPGVVPFRLAVDPNNHVTDGQSEQHHSHQYYKIGQQLYKVQQEHGVTPTKLQTVPPPPRQHLTETILTQHATPQKPAEVAGKSPPTGQYYLTPNYKVYKVPAKHHHTVPEHPPYQYAHPQPVAVYSSTTPRPVSYSSVSPSTTPAPVHETPSYPVYHPSVKPLRHNRTEYANRQRFYPQSMRHPSQHKPRPIPLAPAPVDHEQALGFPAAPAPGSSLADLLKNLQDNNLLPKTLTPDNIDNSIRTLVKILNNLKANGPQRPPVVERPEAPSEPTTYERTNYTTVEPESYVDTDKYRAGPPMLINKIVTPGPNTGRPGIDYPALAEIPETSFSCKEQRYKGFFGDPETNCQVWHYCDLNGGKASFLCPNGTIFSQVALTCDWWFNVKCSTTAQLYVLNERLYKYILPFTPKFPEDYSGPLVDKYLALKFQEMEEKMKQQRAKGAKQGSIEIPNAVPENDEVNGNTLEDNDERYNQNQPYPIRYATTEAVPERATATSVRPSAPSPSSSSSSVPITLEDIDAELHRGSNGGAMVESSSPSSGSSTMGLASPMMDVSEEEQQEDERRSPSAYRTSSVPTTTTLIIATEEPPIDPFRSEEMMMMLRPEGRQEDDDEEEDEYANVVVNAEHRSPSPQHSNSLPTAAPILSKIRRIEVKNDGTSGHLIRNPNYDRRRKK